MNKIFTDNMIYVEKNKYVGGHGEDDLILNKISTDNMIYVETNKYVVGHGEDV